MKKAFGAYNSVNRSVVTNVKQKFQPRLADKVSIVTASTEGIGFAIAKRLAEDGAKIVVSSRNSDKVEAAVESLKQEGFQHVIGVPCHVGKPEDREKIIEETLKTYGGIDALVHCAGVSPSPGKILECTSAMFDKIMEVNLKSALEFCKLVRPHMVARNGGNIVFLSSAAAFESTLMELGLYSVSKLALNGLTKAVAKNLVEDNIRVNCVVAGLTKTKFANIIMGTDEHREACEGTIAMKRLAEPHEMSGIVSFMLSDDASYMTGENVVIAGGAMVRI